MAASTVFLQADIDDSAIPRAGYKGVGSTDAIRAMLREQKRASKSLHSNTLFKEFHADSKLSGTKRFGKGFNTPFDAGVPPPAFDDATTEGNSRLVSLIENQAIKDEKPMAGVWASFGKPYLCLGEPQDPAAGLPFKLNRDEIAAQMDAKVRGGKGGRQRALAEIGPKPPGTAGSFRRALSTANSLDSNGDTRLTPEEQEEQRLTKHRTVIVSTVHDKMEIKFPKGPLHRSNVRATNSKVTIGAFLDTEDAEAECNDPEASYGQPHVPVREKIPLHEKKGLGRRRSPGGRGRKGTNGASHESQFEDDDAKSQVFITQGEGQEQPLEQEYSKTQSMSGRRDSSMIGLDNKPMHRSSAFGAQSLFAAESQSHSPVPMSGGVDGDDESGEERGEEVFGGSGRPPAPGSFQPLVKPSIAPRGQGDNPVYSWHNKFVDVRQRGRDKLQKALYERAEGRLKARTQGRMAANLSGLLMLDLEAVKGMRGGYIGGAEPSNPYGRMERTWNALEESKRARTQKALTLDPEELKALQRFYDQLCALVEGQEKMSDPICLMIVHKVRDLLESGSMLHKSLLNLVIDHVASFAKGAGLIRYNRFLLTILTFIAKCSGASDFDLEDIVAHHGIQIMVYGTDYVSCPPSQGTGKGSKNFSALSRSVTRSTTLSKNGMDSKGTSLLKEMDSFGLRVENQSLPSLGLRGVLPTSGPGPGPGPSSSSAVGATKPKTPRNTYTPPTLKDMPLDLLQEETAKEKITNLFSAGFGI